MPLFLTMAVCGTSTEKRLETRYRISCDDSSNHAPSLFGNVKERLTSRGGLNLV